MSGLGLGDYGSSDEDEASPQQVPEAQTASVPAKLPIKSDLEDLKPQPNSSQAAREATIKPDEPSIPIAESNSPNGNSIGPALEQSALPGPAPPPNDSGSPSQLPDTDSRLLIRNLTMPPVPNFNIPGSPPGSPPAGPTEKFAKFLELKKKGVHFNEKLQTSSALRNPGLLQKLMDFAGISQEEQYASALPRELAVPTTYPEWAYADRLNRSQDKISKKREAEKAQSQRESVEFVPASSSGRDAMSGSGRNARTSAAERVMAGLNQRESPSAKSDTGGRSPKRKKSRFDR